MRWLSRLLSREVRDLRMLLDAERAAHRATLRRIGVLTAQRWRVRHPGIGVLTYPDEHTARTAAGTAGVVYPPGESHRSTP